MAQSVEFWFRKKYNLTANDPRFLSLSIEDMLTDFWAHHYYDNPNTQEEFENPDFDSDFEEMFGETDYNDWENLG